MKSKISEFKKLIPKIKKEFTTILTNQKVKMRNYRKQLNQVISEFSKEYIENNKRKAKTTPKDPKSTINKIKSNSEIEKIVFSHPPNDKKLKTVLSANSLFEFKMMINSEIKELQSDLNEIRQNNQREIFETQFKFGDEKNSYLKNFSELISIIKLAIDNQAFSKKLDKEYKEAQMKKKIEIEKIKNQLDREYFEKKEKIESKNNRIFPQNQNKNIFEQERRKYEAEFHQLSEQLIPKTSEERKKVMKYDLISEFMKEIEFENKRHSLQMLLFDLMRSSRTTIRAAVSNSTNAINLLREAIKRQIEINKQSVLNMSTNSSLNRHSSMNSIDDKDVNEEDFKMEKNRIALRAIKTSESNRTNSLNMQRKLDKQRLELLNFYENKIKEIQEQKDTVKKEIVDFNEKTNAQNNAIKYKLFALVETYQQLSRSEIEGKQKMVDKINSKYDEKIEKLKTSIQSLKSGNRSNTAVEAKIGKMNWHCELLNSQLLALTKQLRVAQRNSKNPDQAAKIQKRVKSSIQLTPIPHTTH